MGPQNWDDWLEGIKTKAEGGEIWKYVDPSISKADLPQLEHPNFSDFPQSQSLPTNTPQPEGSTHTIQNQPIAPQPLEFQRFLFKRQVKQYDRQKAALADLRSYIQETVSADYVHYTYGCDTPHDMLVSLKRRVSPTDQSRRYELRAKYQKLMEVPREQSIEAWLRQWEKTYSDCKKAKLPIVEDAMLDFLNAIATIAPEFATLWNTKISRKQKSRKEVPDIYEVIDEFRNDRRNLASNYDPMDDDNQSADSSHMQEENTSTLEGSDTESLDDPASSPTSDETPETHEAHETPETPSNEQPQDCYH